MRIKNAETLISGPDRLRPRCLCERASKDLPPEVVCLSNNREEVELIYEVAIDGIRNKNKQQTIEKVPFKVYQSIGQILLISIL